MFEQALAVEYGNSHRALATMAGMAVQVLAVTAAVVLPIAVPGTLPAPQTLVHIFLPHAPVAPPAPPAGTVTARPQPRTDLQFRYNVLTAPGSVPPHPVAIDEPPLAAGEAGGAGNGVPGGIPGGAEGGVLGGLPAYLTPALAPPASVPRAAEPTAPAPVRAAEPQRIRQGGQVQEALLIRRVMPLYPPLARQARVSGVVELTAVVGVDGRIRQLQLVRGHPMLAAAAMDAVRQWIYRPTYLNGDPVEVVAPVIVTFTLN